MNRNKQLKEIKEQLGHYITYYLGYYDENNFRIYSQLDIFSSSMIKDFERLGFQFVGVSIDDSLHVFVLFEFKG